MDWKTRTAAALILLATTSLSADPAFAPLDLKWANHIRRYPGGEKTVSQQERHRKEFKRLHAAAFRLYKQKEDAEAIRQYEAALRRWATGELYYNYGNSLSNIPRLADSVKAYRIAVALNFKKKHLAWFNMACAYSRMKDRKNSFAALKEAVKSGYTWLNYITTDGDLAWLREGPNWTKQLEEIRKIRDTLLYGKAVFRNLRWGMIPWQVLKLEKAPRVREGLYRGSYLLWFRTQYLGKKVLLKYLFDNQWYRLQYGAYCFLHLERGAGEQKTWTGFDSEAGGEISLPPESGGSKTADPAYTRIRTLLEKKYGKPAEEESLSRQGAVFSRTLRWKTADHHITLHAYGDDTAVDVSVYFSRTRLVVNLLK